MLNGNRLNVDSWIFCNIKITVAFQMVVACAIIGIDSVGFDLSYNGTGCQVGRVKIDRALKTCKSTVDGNAKVFDVKCNGRFGYCLWFCLGKCVAGEEQKYQQRV